MEATISPYCYPGMRGVRAKRKGDPVNPAEIISRVCEAFGVTQKQMELPTRQKNILTARQVVMFILMKHTALGCVAIGKLFNRDHTTVLHACGKIKDDMTTYPEFGHFMEDMVYGRSVISRGEALPVVVMPHRRLPGVYSNAGYINLQKKYV